MTFSPQPSAAHSHSPGHTDVPGSRRAWMIWAIATVFLVWLFTIQTGYAIVSPQIQLTAHLDVSQISLAASVYTATFAVVQVFSGALLDRFGSRPLMAIAIALVTAGAFLYAATTNLPTLVAAQIVLALGSSFGFVGGGYVVASWFRAAQFGLLLSLIQAAGAVGSAVMQPVISAALGAMSWQDLQILFGVIGIAITVAAAALVRDPSWKTLERREAPHTPLLRGIWSGIAQSIRSPAVRYGAIVAAAGLGAMLAIGTLWGPRIATARGFSDTQGAWLTALAWLGSAAGAPIANLVSNRIHSRRSVVIVALSGLTLSLAVLLFLPDGGTLASFPTLAVAMFAFGFFSGVSALGYAIGADNVPRSLAGSATAVTNAFAFAIAAIFQSLPSVWLPQDATLSDYRVALSVILVALLLATILTIILRPHIQIPAR